MELSQVMGVPLPVVMYDHDLVLKHGDDWASPSLRIPKRCHSALRVASIIPNLFSSSDPHPDILSWHSFWRTIWKNQYAGYMYVGTFLTVFLTVFLTDTLSVFLAFYLAPILTYFLAYMLTFFLDLYFWIFLASILTFFSWRGFVDFIRVASSSFLLPSSPSPPAASDLNCEE